MKNLLMVSKVNMIAPTGCDYTLRIHRKRYIYLILSYQRLRQNQGLKASIFDLVENIVCLDCFYKTASYRERMIDYSNTTEQ